MKPTSPKTNKKKSYHRLSNSKMSKIDVFYFPLTHNRGTLGTQSIIESRNASTTTYIIIALKRALDLIIPNYDDVLKHFPLCHWCFPHASCHLHHVCL